MSINVSTTYFFSMPGMGCQHTSEPPYTRWTTYLIRILAANMFTTRSVKSIAGDGDRETEAAPARADPACN